MTSSRTSSRTSSATSPWTASRASSRYCPDCRDERVFEQPPCLDDHEDCPEWVCVDCGYAILVGWFREPATVTDLRPELGSDPGTDPAAGGLDGDPDRLDERFGGAATSSRSGSPAGNRRARLAATADGSAA